MNIENFNTDKKDFEFTIDVRFNTKTPITPRILKVSEAFGLGVSEEKDFVIYDDFKIGFSKGDVVFVTGDSGGGKSLLLKEIYNKLETNTTTRLEDINPKPDEIIIDSIGNTLEEGIYYLSMMGLNDAFIFLRRYKELSDGQKYRYRLAKLLATNSEIMFIDEFCANLDRTTAKVISYNLQRVIRKENKVAIVATTHTDIEEDLNPSVLVKKRFMDELELKYIDYNKRKISFYDDVVFELGTMVDYKKLSKYHYKNTKTNFPYIKIVKAMYGRELVGIVVYSPPFLQTKGRTIKYDKKYSRMTKPVVAEINKRFVRGSRYIISPKYRACGLGQKLASESMKYVKDKETIEIITVMGQFNPVFEKIGMDAVPITEETDPPTIRLDLWMKEKGLDVDEIHNPTYWKNWVDNQSDEDKTTLKLMTGKVLHHPKIGLSCKDGRRAEVVAQEKRYKEVDFLEVEEEIKIHIPKLYSGMTIYYVMQNPYFVETQIQTLGDFT